MAFSPVKASKEIALEYSRYLTSIFSLNDPDYQQQFSARLREMPFSSGPYLEVTDAFETGKTVRELMEAGDLPRDYDRLGFEEARLGSAEERLRKNGKFPLPNHEASCRGSQRWNARLRCPRYVDLPHECSGQRPGRTSTGASG